jgi:hypothetical protein
MLQRTDSEKGAIHDRDNASERWSPVKRRRTTFSDAVEQSPLSTASFSHERLSPMLWHSSLHATWPSVTVSITGDTVETASLAESMHTRHADRQEEQGLTGRSDSLSGLNLGPAVWPLTQREEARLLRYYIEHLSQNFDLTDPLRHFRDVV